MRSFSRSWTGRLSAAGCALLVAATLAHARPSQSANQSAPAKTAASPHKTSGKHKKSNKANWRTRGQKKIDPKRAHEIQEALIREHYLNGKASGAWDNATQEAMQKYQADHGWQSKTTPDARALIQLGLGPDHEHLLNPESAMTSQPETPHSGSAPAPATPADSPASPQR